MNHITTSPSKTQGTHESSNTWSQKQPLHLELPRGPQLLTPRQMSLRLDPTQDHQFPPSRQTAQHPPSSQTHELFLSRRMLHLPSVSPSTTSQTQDGTFSLIKESLVYVNAKQFDRIQKRRMARQRLAENAEYTPGIRKPYIHESRHKHAMRRPRGPGGKFLTKDELKRKIKNVQSGTTDKSQTPKTRTGPNISHAKIESVDWAARIPTKDEKGERSKNVRNGSRDKGIDEPQAKQASNVRSEHQIETKRPFKISKAMTTSFYGATELKDLHKRFSTKTAADYTCNH